MGRVTRWGGGRVRSYYAAPAWSHGRTASLANAGDDARRSSCPPCPYPCRAHPPVASAALRAAILMNSARSRHISSVEPLGGWEGRPAGGPLDKQREGRTRLSLKGRTGSGYCGLRPARNPKPQNKCTRPTQTAAAGQAPCEARICGVAQPAVVAAKAPEFGGAEEAVDPQRRHLRGSPGSCVRMFMKGLQECCWNHRQQQASGN